MKEVQDRVIQFSNRYKLTDAGTGTELGTYDFTEVTGTVQQAGTPIDKELFDSIKEDIDIVNGDIDDIVEGTTPIANTVRYTAQELTAEQQEQARENIGALGEDDITINLNGAKVTSPSFYAPTTSGTAGQVLKSMGAGQAPVWGEAQKKDIANATVTLGASLTYNGSAQTQTVASVKLGSVTLRAGTDYDISGNVATNAGNYTLIVSGKGDYTGFIFVDWSIAKAQGSISAPVSVDIVGAVGTQKQVTVVIESGYGDLAVSSSAPNVVSASTVGNVIMLTSVSVGSATITVKLVGNYSAETNISVRSAIPSTVLNDNSWETIRIIADNDLGDSYWAVGDTKAITLNGTVGTKTYGNVTVWAYILGFNHNPEVEGEHLIHFGGFKTAQTDGTDVGLVDSSYGSGYTGGQKVFNVNHWGDNNYGGWAACDARYDILGSTNVAPSNYGSKKSSGATGNNPTSSCATSPVANTLMAALPADLRAVMKPVTKYTDNRGGGSNTASNVTATTDYLWSLAEYEVQGTHSRANSYEQNYQEQYDYYANGNSKVKYKHTASSEAVSWRLRSPYYNATYYFCTVNTDGSAYYGNAYISRALAPAFAV